MHLFTLYYNDSTNLYIHVFISSLQQLYEILLLFSFYEWATEKIKWLHQALTTSKGCTWDSKPENIIERPE